MRGSRDQQPAFLYNFSYDSLIPADHPLRGIKRLAEQELKRLEPRFRAAYSSRGRPSIPPETLILASLLQALYGISSERMLCEQLAYNFLFRWFVGLLPDEAVFNHSTFSHNRKRFADHGFMQAFFDSTVAAAIREQAVSCEHFSVDGSLIQSFASMKSVKRKDDDTPHDSGQWADWHGEKRSNETHESKTDPEARLYRKGRGQPALLAHSMHIVVDNRAGFVMGVSVDEASGTAERRNALGLARHLRQRHKLKPRTIAADKGYDSGEHLLELERLGITPQIALRGITPASDTAEADARRRMRLRSRSAEYAMSQRCRRLVEKPFAWLKRMAGLGRTRYRERWKTGDLAAAGAAALNLLRLSKLAPA
jgi:transposase